MRYELLYYELREKKFNSKKNLEKFLKKLTIDQQLRVIRKEKKVSYVLIKTIEGFKEK